MTSHRLLIICRLGLLAGVAVVSGCGGEHLQSALHPRGPAAAKIAQLGWLMFGVFGAIMLAVTVLMLVAVFRAPRETSGAPPLGSTRFIVLGGIVLPSIILVALLFITLETTLALRAPSEGLTIRVIGHQWWWEVHYPEQGFTTANEIHIPVGRPVKLELTSTDVIHSFWVPNLNGKCDMIPGHLNRFWIQADRPDVYRGQCAEFCGVQHTFMAFHVVAHPPVEFDAWLAARRKPASTQVSPEFERGREVFFRARCHTCHTIRGTEASGRIGPELSDIGSRRTIGAAALANTPGNLAGWIANPQPLKLGNRMPPTYLAAEDMHALVAYLRNLK